MGTSYLWRYEVALYLITANIQCKLKSPTIHTSVFNGYFINIGFTKYFIQPKLFLFNNENVKFEYKTKKTVDSNILLMDHNNFIPLFSSFD